MAKFGVKVVVLVDNMPLVFFYFSPKPFKKKFLHSLYYEKKIRTKLPTKKKNSCRGNFSTPLPGYLMSTPNEEKEAKNMPKIPKEGKSMHKLEGSLGVGSKSCICNVHKPIPINSHITK